MLFGRLPVCRFCSSTVQYSCPLYLAADLLLFSVISSCKRSKLEVKSSKKNTPRPPVSPYVPPSTCIANYWNFIKFKSSAVKFIFRTVPTSTDRVIDTQTHVQMYKRTDKQAYGRRKLRGCEWISSSSSWSSTTTGFATVYSHCCRVLLSCSGILFCLLSPLFSSRPSFPCP